MSAKWSEETRAAVGLARDAFGRPQKLTESGQLGTARTLSADELTARDHHPSNRAARRQLSTTPAPGSVPVQVSRELPVSIIMGADGSRQVVEMDTAEPCFGCACCALWSITVDSLRVAMVEHENGRHSGQGAGYDLPARRTAAADTFAGCLVCQLLAGVVDV